ncbi:MAG: PAS-domain containing protein [Holosporales bacterium]
MTINQATTVIDFLGSLRRLVSLVVGLWFFFVPVSGGAQSLWPPDVMRQTVEIEGVGIPLWLGFAGVFLFIVVLLGIFLKIRNRDKKNTGVVPPPFVMDIAPTPIFQVEPLASRAAPVVASVTTPIDRLPAQLRALIDKMPTPAWTRTAEGHLIFVNEAYTHAVGHSFLEVLEQQIEFVSVEVTAKNQAPTDGMTQRHTLIIDGQPRLFEISEMPLQDGSGTVGFACDVSAVCALEYDIEHQSQVYQGILDRVDTAVALFDTKKRLVFYNDAFVHMWELTTDILADQTLTVERIFEHKQKIKPFLHANDYERFIAKQKQIFRSIVAEEKVILEFLEGRVLDISIIPQKTGGLLYCYRDISEQTRNQKAVDAAYHAAKHAGDIFGIGLLWLNAAHQPVRWNAKLLEIFDFNEDVAGEVLWQTIINALKEDDAEKLQHFLLSTHDDSVSVSLANNSTVKVRAKSLETEEILIVFEDTSRQTALEQQYRQNITQYGVFLQKYCRELLDLGDAIAAFSTLAQRSDFPQAKRYDYITFMHNASVQLQKTLQTTLKLIAAQTRKATLSLSETQLLPTLRTVVNIVDKEVKSRGVKLNFFLAADVGSLFLDEEKFRQAIEQFLLFLIRHTSEGGVITVQGQRDNQGVTLIFQATNALIPLPVAALFTKDGSFLDYGEQLHHFGVLLAVADLHSHGATVQLIDNPPFETRIKCCFGGLPDAQDRA